MKVSPNSFLILSALGFVLLWGFAISTGTLSALNEVQASGFYPDGRPLRSIYTGFRPIDWALETLVAFFDAFNRPAAHGPRQLCIDIVVVLHCVNVWTVIDSRRRGVRTEWMRHFGAAVVLPLYCYCICLSGATKRDHTIPLNEARAFVPMAIVGSTFSALIFVPAALNWGPHHEHGGIAHYMWVTAVGYLLVLVVASRPGATSKKDPKNPDVDWIFVTISYILAGTWSAAVHAYTLWRSFTSSDPDLSLSRLFIPSPSAAGQPTANLFVEGAHLFTQFDWHIVALTCMVFAYYQIEQGTKIQAPLTSLLGLAAEQETALVVGFIVVTTALLGPGAAASFGLAIREYGLRAATTKPIKTR
ncbi:MAG: hypothetical protein Q9203_004943 [Teloschistes exilis]